MKKFCVLLLVVSFINLSNLKAIDTDVKITDINTTDAKTSDQYCTEIESKGLLRGGWYQWEPYQYKATTKTTKQVTGLDIELAKYFIHNAGFSADLEQLSWKQILDKIKDGAMDIAFSATKSDSRAEFAYFSLPYRFEENSIFMSRTTHKILHFKDVAELIGQIRIQNFRLGVVEGFIYVDPQINKFIADNNNDDIVFTYMNDASAMSALVRGEIDGLIADRVVGANIILNMQISGSVKELPINVRVPIHMILSKKSVSPDVVEKLNSSISNAQNSTVYKSIVKKYIYPVFLLEVVNADWFYILGIIGTIAFAASGIIVAISDNSTLFQAFILAMLPSVGGGILRDILINREKIELFLTPTYMYYVLTVTLIGFVVTRTIEFYRGTKPQAQIWQTFGQHLLIVCDLLGQAAFIVTGVTAAVIYKIEPIALWGPFLAFLTSSGGIILRDIFRNKNISIFNRAMHVEMSVLWGFVFAIMLNKITYHPNSVQLEYYVIITVVGSFITGIVAYYFKIPNIKMKSERYLLQSNDILQHQDIVPHDQD